LPSDELSFREQVAIKFLELGIAGAALYFMWDITKALISAG